MKSRFSFSNFYVRNGIAYLITIAVGVLTFIDKSHPFTGKRFLAASFYYTFVFFWVVFHNRILVQKFLLKKKIIFYILSIPLVFLIWYPVAMVASRNADLPVDPVNELFIYIIFTTLGVSIFLSTKYLLEQKKFYQTSLLKREMEIQQLKSQLNPHFLFNALNNIYSYTLHSNKFGNELILKLSELMRFILDSAERNKITIEEEIKFVENYIAFEKERLGDRCDIKYDKKINYKERKIAPLILFPFIENAFKYGSNTIEKTNIEILIVDNPDNLRLVVKNSIINKDAPSTKKGLPNATRRLELLYPGAHDLLISQEGNMFVVELNLKHEKD